MAKKKLKLSSFTSKLIALKNVFVKNLSIIFIVLSIGMYSFLVFRINSLLSLEPNKDSLKEKLQTVQRPKIDQLSVTKIQQLQDNSVDVRTLFKDARDNPFQE